MKICIQILLCNMATLFSKNCILLILSVAYFVTTEEINEDTLVQLKEGKIRGHILKSENGADYYAFQEIPYAAPPVGENRLQLPKKVSSWEGVLDTTKNTKICYQAVNKYSNHEMSEDCLYINVYTPVKPNSNTSKLPVLLWIHGGAYTAGSGAYEYYGPKYIMDHGVVVVSFNYRLGALGFATTEDDIIPGNIALKDQKFAIEWVSENIHLFSGDADQVTLVGESAGSFSVGLQILGQTNNKRELFRAAIMQSGSPLGGLVQLSARENLFNCGRILDKNFVSNDSTDLLSVLQRASAVDYLTACSGASGTVVENEGDFAYAPFQSLMNGQFKKVPVLMGFNSEEWIFSAISPDMNTLVSLDNDPAQLVPSLMNMSPENRSIAGQLLKKLYTNDSFEKDIGAYCRWSSDNVMITHICKHAEVSSSQVPIYFYEFSYYGDLGEGPTDIIPGAGRVAHAEDLHYMWDDGSNSDLSKFPEEDRLTLHRFVKMWTNFVKYLNPTPENDSLLDNMVWPTTDSDNLRYLNFNDTLEIKEYPRQYKDVKRVLEQYMQPPFNYY